MCISPAWGEGTRPTPLPPPQHCISRAHVWSYQGQLGPGSVSAQEVSRVMGGAPERNKNSKKIYVKWYLGEGFCKCCQPRIHWYDIHKCRWNVLRSDERTQWTVHWCSSAQMATPFTCSFNIFYIYQAFILLFHKALHPPSLFPSLSVHLSLSLSCCGARSRFPN